MRRAISAWAWILALTGLAAPSFADTPKKWNVLLLLADDWRPELGCYGSPSMQTPHLDKLAATGVRFDRAYCQFPVCNPSRASMMTGRFPNQTKVVFNGTHLRDIHPDWTTLPQHFKNNGYTTALAGKVFHGKFPDPVSWTEIVEESVPREFRRKAPERNADSDENGSGPAGVKFVTLEGNGESDKDYHIAADGIRLLEKYREGPFFIGIGFHRPHAIPTAPRRFYEMYDVAKMQLPADFAPRPTVPPGTPELALPKDNDTYMNSGDTSPETAREVIRAYRASASWTDWNMGRVLDALDRLGLADNTIVVFAGDHGYHNGEKGRWGKTTIYEIAQRVPFIVRLPGGAKGVCPRTVQLMDVYPTLVELCGLPSADGLQGHSLVPLLNDPQAAWPYAAFTMNKTGGGPIGYSVHTDRWHYGEWRGGQDGAVLFDLEADPMEMKNLAAESQQAERISEMKTLLKQAFGEMPFRIPAVRPVENAK